MADINCTHPRVILHPYAKSYFVRFGAFCFDGVIDYTYLQMSTYRRSDLYSSLKLFKIAFKKYGDHFASFFTHDTLLDNFHFIDHTTGEVYPMFLIVPCGKCELCCYDKLQDISARCALETYVSKSRPLFVTLTYDNEHLPTDGSVSLHDIQKFLKLLRVNLNRFTGVKQSLRYLYCSEYTPNNKRPHYHLLIWNVPYLPQGLSDRQKLFFQSRLKGCPYCYEPTSSVPCNLRTYSTLYGNSITCDLGRVNGYDTLKKLIWCSWRKGFIKVEVSRDAGSYVAKYIGKGSAVPSGRKPTFVRWSTRRGLGFGAFDLYFKKLLLDNPSLTSISFMDPKVGKLSTVRVPKYYRTLLCPCLSVFSRPFKKQLVWFHHAFHCLKYIFKSGVFYDKFNDFKASHASVYQKYLLFVDSCGLCINTLDKECKCYLDDVLSRNYGVLITSNEIIDMLDNYWTIYDYLIKFDLESFHLQDLLSWKVLNSIYRKDYAEFHAPTIDESIFKVSNINKHYEIVARSNDYYEEYISTDERLCKTS